MCFGPTEAPQGVSMTMKVAVEHETVETVDGHSANGGSPSPFSSSVSPKDRKNPSGDSHFGPSSLTTESHASSSRAQEILAGLREKRERLLLSGHQPPSSSSSASSAVMRSRGANQQNHDSGTDNPHKHEFVPAYEGIPLPPPAVAVCRHGTQDDDDDDDMLSMLSSPSLPVSRRGSVSDIEQAMTSTITQVQVSPRSARRRSTADIREEMKQRRRKLSARFQEAMRRSKAATVSDSEPTLAHDLLVASALAVDDNDEGHDSSESWVRLMELMTASIFVCLMFGNTAFSYVVLQALVSTTMRSGNSNNDSKRQQP